MYPQGDASTGCCGSHQVQVHGVWSSWLTASDLSIGKACCKLQCCLRWSQFVFVLLLLLFYGLECSTVVGRGGVVCKCCCMFISNIFRVGDGSTILPILVLLGRADIFTRYFPHSIPHMLDGCISWQLWDIFCPWLTFLLVEESTGLRLWFSESRQTFPSEFSTLSDSLVQGSPSFQGFPAFFVKSRVWFLGNGGCPWDAVICGLGYVFNKGL